MRSNIFKPINAGDTRMGTFFMFSQYTDDLTKEQSMKGTYRVVPSKFVALELNVDNVINNSPVKFKIGDQQNPQQGIVNDNSQYYLGTTIPLGINDIIPQILQSYYENSVAFFHNHTPEGFDWENTTRNYASELLWRTLEDWGFITLVRPSTGDNPEFEYYDEIKYIGDINIHSNRKIGNYSYDEIFCHIPSRDDEYYYPLNAVNKTWHTVDTGWNDGMLQEWSEASYPTGDNVLSNTGVAYFDGNAGYHLGGNIPVLKENSEHQKVPRHSDSDKNIEYKFNAVIVFYDVLYSEPGNDPQYLYEGRPMGIYISGPMDDSGEEISIQNTFVKYISNNDAYGQGSSFGLRIMMRYAPTPNSSTYTMEVDGSGHDYDTIAAAMGGIADAIIDINRSCKDQHAMFQAYKDHLAMFRNRRVNVPYPREVNGVMYWFVNGRNTGQPLYPLEYAPQPEPPVSVEDVVDSVEVSPEGSGNITGEEVPQP